MKALLVLGGPSLSADALVAGLHTLRHEGWDVDLVTWRALDPTATSLADEVVVLAGPPARTPVVAGAAGARWQRALGWRLNRVRQVWRRRALPATQRVGRRAGLGVDAMAFSLRFHADVDAVRLARRADVVVAVDRDATVTCWRLARKRPDVTAVNGLGSLAYVLRSGA